MGFWHWLVTSEYGAGFFAGLGGGMAATNIIYGVFLLRGSKSSG